MDEHQWSPTPGGAFECPCGASRRPFPKEVPMTVPTNNEEAEALARLFHETYERLAPEFDYSTRVASAVPWEDVPANNKRLMIAVAGEILAARHLPVSGDNAERVQAREEYLAQPVNFGTDSRSQRMAEADAFDAGWSAAVTPSGREGTEMRNEDVIKDQRLWDVDAWDPEGKGLITDRALVGVSSRRRIVAEIRGLTILQLQHPGSCENCGHRSDCALHNGPAVPVEPCDCKDSLSASQPCEVEVEVAEILPLEDVIEGIYNHGGLKAIIDHERSEGNYCCEVGCGSGACETCPCCAAGSCLGGVEVTDDMVERGAVAMYFEDCGNSPDARERATEDFDAQFRAMARIALVAALGGGE